MGSHKTSKGASTTTTKTPGLEAPVTSHAKRRKQGAHEEVPGVQKIKAALRQTKRLLAKENLAADVRVTTERRLKSLEGDLAKAERARTERTMAMRYHKVKFFERQKVLRKIAQAKRILESGVDADNEKLRKKKRKLLEAELTERRIDLNYILHYPKASKYISLFPPSSNAEGDDSDAEATEDSEKHVLGKEEVDVTSRKRQELRDAIRDAMNAGKISLQPEMDLVDRSGTSVHVTTAQTESTGGLTAGTSKPRAQVIEDDGFFEISVD